VASDDNGVITAAGADEARLREAIELANVPILLPVLVQLTGDDRWLQPPYLPTRNRGLDDNPSGGLPEQIQAEIRAAALSAILAWWAGGPVALPDPEPELMVRMLSVVMGEEIPAEYGPMLAEEAAISTEPRVEEPVEVPPGFRVLIVGGGVSGLTMGLKLGQMGIPFTILEKNAEIGGTWYENRYPGAGVDTPSALYSFSFSQDHQWTKFFALRDELYGYLKETFEQAGVLSSVQLETEVVSATYDEVEQGWAVTARRADGSTEELTANVVITAVGALNRPKWPAIDGLDRFAGTLVHTARWPDDLDLTGRRVGVIGNGASSMQLVPAIAERVESVTVFQRSPQWAAPFELLHVDIAEPLRWLIAAVPPYRVWYRLRAGWTFNDRIHSTLQKDPEWEHPERSVNAVNDAHRRFFTRYMESMLGDHPELLAKALPDYPPYGKRILLDNGWFRSLTRDNVHLVTDRIGEITPDGVVTEDGTAHEFDVLVCATGFQATRFLSPMDLHGRSGVGLREVWQDEDARAYMGMTVPDYPNLLMLYGPNAQGGHGGSLIGTAEMQTHYLASMLRQMLERGIGAIEPRRELYDDYNRRVDEAHEQMIWTHPGMDTYYRNSRGRVVVNTPWRVIDYWEMTRDADLDEYVVEPARALTETG
jgi:4-hydroxyacetophenone monooxygenase